MSAVEEGDYVVYAIKGTRGHLNWGVHDAIIKCDVAQYDTEAECYAWIDGYNYSWSVNQ